MTYHHFTSLASAEDQLRQYQARGYLGYILELRHGVYEVRVWA